MALDLVTKTVDDWLDEVDYAGLNSGHYLPGTFALKFMNFIKLVNGETGEQNLTPVVHLAMLDKISGRDPRIANLCARGIAKTTLMFEYLVLYLAVFGEIDDFGAIEGMIYISDSMDNGVKSARKNVEFRWTNSDFLQTMLPPEGATFNDNYLEFKTQEYLDTKGKKGTILGCKMFGAKSGLRGTKVFGKRPTLAVLDDLVSDDDAKSRVAMNAISDTISKGIDYALHPTKRKIIFNGTPFAKNDVLYAAVESGAWKVNVWPVCEKFPCTEEEFNGAWEDRFTYAFVRDQYDKAVMEGKLSAFYQELMLRISTDDERLVQDGEIRWYSRADLLKNRGKFNYYITTDFATTDRQTSDNSVISVWAYNANGDWFWVDGTCARQTMDKSIDALFRHVTEYRPQSVGIEITGQQGAFIQWLQSEMMSRNIWFNFAQENGKPGVRPTSNKLSRFNLVVPLFKAGKIYFPSEMKTSKVVSQFLSEITLATVNGLKGKDDCLDTISMLMNLKTWKPSEDAIPVETAPEAWAFSDTQDDDDRSPLSSYVV